MKECSARFEQEVEVNAANVERLLELEGELRFYFEEGTAFLEKADECRYVSGRRHSSCCSSFACVKALLCTYCSCRKRFSSYITAYSHPQRINKTNRRYLSFWCGPIKRVVCASRHTASTVDSCVTRDDVLRRGWALLNATVSVLIRRATYTYIHRVHSARTRNVW